MNAPENRVSSHDAVERVASAPFRVAPLGAHTDHQEGLVTGFALDLRMRVRFRPRDDREIHATSETFEGRVAFTIGEEGPPLRDFGDYLKGVVRELSSTKPDLFGLDARIEADLPPGGIGSSAALQIAFLSAIAARNGVSLDAATTARLVLDAERNYAGVPVGPLDPAIILYGAAGKLVRLDCREGVPKAQRLPKGAAHVAFVVVDSGVRRDLRQGLYAERVEQCRQAAAALGAVGAPPVLRDVTLEDLRRRRRELDPILAARAEHVLTENKRVRDGVAALQQGDLATFFALVDASGESMATRFEAATPETDLLRKLLRAAPGVRAATFAGAGFGGSVLGLGTTDLRLDAIEAHVRPKYAEAFPDAASKASFRKAGVGGGFGVDL